jgi:hypothetical protein
MKQKGTKSIIKNKMAHPKKKKKKKKSKQTNKQKNYRIRKFYCDTALITIITLI